jgi:hypothetical protein
VRRGEGATGWKWVGIVSRKGKSTDGVGGGYIMGIFTAREGESLGLFDWGGSDLARMYSSGNAHLWRTTMDFRG